jgi:hypothetical protein
MVSWQTQTPINYFGHTGQTWGGYMITDEDGKCGTSGYLYNTDASATSLEGSTGDWKVWDYLSSSWETDATYTVTCLDTEASDDDADDPTNMDMFIMSDVATCSSTDNYSFIQSVSDCEAAALFLELSDPGGGF